MTKKGSLRDIGAQEGDTVELVYNGNFETECSGESGEVFTEGKELCVRLVTGTRHDTFGHKFRIVKRFSKSPVRVVTHKELVPGVYGSVVVYDTKKVSCTLMKVEDLSAAIATLTAIRDAMVA